ncbi:MAG TPA: flagellar M-ring protein FliF [Desulfobacterales bacterium]|nr:flagellar M-ring protein FliF [Desulfobacterales bacterium]HIP39837.1 flagellar M-ring protein FliF [Desulfocapsa sulfexigens]
MAEEDIVQKETTEEPEIQIPERKNMITLVKEWPLSRKIALAAVTVISMALFAVLIIQARTADYQLLYANLTEKDAAPVVSWLKGQKINYQLKNNGKNIWIPADQIYETRLELASGGLPSGGGVGFEIFDKQSFALTDFVQKVNYTRALQGELARTITSLAPVEATRVHLAIPEKRLFKNQQKDTTASIVVTLAKGRTLDKSQVQGIIHLVSGSVEGLSSEGVTVIDSNGKVLEGIAKDDDDQRISVDMLVFQQNLERRMESRAQDLLDKTMGYGQAMVRVTASLDFAKTEKTEELYDAEEPVIRSEQVQSESNGGSSTGGIPGVQSNLQGNSGGEAGGSSSSSKSSRTTNYEISKTISKTVNPAGTIKNLSVSVLLADRIIPAKDEESQPTSETRSQKELQAVETMVARALGINTERGDKINVTSMPFMEPSEDQSLAGEMPKNLLYEYLPLVKIGLISIGTLLFYFLLVRPIIKTMKTEVSDHNKTVTELEQAVLDVKNAKEEADQEQEPEDFEEFVPDSVIALRHEIMQNQVPTAYIIKNWINEG